MRASVLLYTLLISSPVWAQTLTVGFGTDKPPYVIEKDKSGLEVEIIEKAGEAAGFQVVPVFAPMARLKLMIEEGSLDVITTTNRNEKGSFNYSDTYIVYHNFAIALQKSRLKINKISDLRNYSISSFQRAQKLLGPEFEAMTRQNPKYAEFADQKLRNLHLYSGRAQVVISDRRIFRYFNTQLGSVVDVNQPVVWYDIFPVTEYQAAFRSKDVVKKFNEGLAQIRNNGTYRKLEAKYNQFDLINAVTAPRTLAACEIR